MKLIEEIDERGRSAPADVPWTIWTDARITRRKFYHLVANPSGAIVFRARDVGRALQWLEAEGVGSFRVCTEFATYVIREPEVHPINRGKS